MTTQIDAADRERLCNPTTTVEVELLDAARKEIATLRASLVAAKARAEAAEREAEGWAKTAQEWSNKHDAAFEAQVAAEKRAGEAERRFDAVRARVAWHRDGQGPDVPVSQERYDQLRARAESAERRADEALGALREWVESRRSLREWMRDKSTARDDGETDRRYARVEAAENACARVLSGGGAEGGGTTP
jgi:hypothetical protein